MPKIGKIQVEFEGRWREEEVVIEDDPLAPWERDTGYAIVGKPTPRVDGPERVSGKAIYTHDVRLPGMLHGKILRSPPPHARIVDIDTRIRIARIILAKIIHIIPVESSRAVAGKIIFPDRRT